MKQYLVYKGQEIPIEERVPDKVYDYGSDQMELVFDEGKTNETRITVNKNDFEIVEK